MQFILNTFIEYQIRYKRAEQIYSGAAIELITSAAKILFQSTDAVKYFILWGFKLVYFILFLQKYYTKLPNFFNNLLTRAVLKVGTGIYLQNN